jgi:hypothetical protein
MIFLNMDYFFHTLRVQNGKKNSKKIWGFLVWHHEYS